MKSVWGLALVCVLLLAVSVRADEVDVDGTVEDDLGKSREGSRTDDEVVQREEEAIQLDGLNASQIKEIREKSEKFAFQAEVNRMMKLIINSLYKNKEIFLRELISNASDALDKIRLISLTDENALAGNEELTVKIKCDKEKNMLHVTDTGIGMTKEELVKNLGTIAKSGTSEFLNKMTEMQDDSQSTSELIGQFGVGFYSAFLVADRVIVTSKHNNDTQHIWESDSNEFSVIDDPRGNTLGRGTTITLVLKKEASDYLELDTVKNLVKKYSQFINFPIYVWSSKTETVEEPIEEEEAKEKEEEADDEAAVEEEEEEKKPKTKKVEKTVWDWELMNDIKPIWQRPSKEVEEDEYKAFYKTFSKEHDDPMAYIHFTAEGEIVSEYANKKNTGILGTTQEQETLKSREPKTIFGESSGIWPCLKRDRRRDGRSPFGPPGQLAKREQPGTDFTTSPLPTAILLPPPNGEFTKTPTDSSSSSVGRTAIEVGVSPPTPKPRDPPLPSCDSEWDEPEPLPPGPKIPSQGPIASRTRKQTREVIQAPLRQAITSDGETKLIKVPFSSIDLEIWERIAKGYQSDPIGVAKKMKFMIKQHSPDWADLQLLLDALTETEKQLVWKVAGDLAEDDCRTTQEDVKDVFPLQDPGWDPNDDEGLGRLKRYQELIVKGLERAIPKTINWSALYAIKQGPSQTPSEFLDHLRDTMCRHTTLDPESDEGTQQLINLFLGQSTGDIRRKLQKIRGPNSRNLETLLDEAWRVFSNRKEGYKQGMKKLAAVVKEGEKGKHGQGPPKQGPPRLGKDQCAFCKKFGHWKNQCPELRKDLKDAFFCLPLHEASQKIFAFEWESPKTGRKTQLAWCVLPQGYKNSPTIFGEQLAKDLESWEPPPGEGQLLQYVDDLLIATWTQETCVDWTVSLLNFLGLQGYRVSQKKAQMVRQTVIYLGYEVSAGQRTLGQDRKEAICQTPKPHTVKELRTFLGMTGWCRLWIYNYGLLVKPLYALITEGSRDLQWTKDATRAFNQLKKALMSAPALGLPNVSKPFFLFSHEKQGIALGILAQNLGLYRRAVAYLSKQLDTTAKGWPGCLRAVAAVAINIQEVRKFTLGQKMTVLVSHTMSAVLEAKGGHWLSPQRFLKYQAILVEQDDVEIVVTNIVNPASFLSRSTGEPVIHDCLETIEATYSSRPDLKDTPLEDADTWFTDGSSYVVSGRRHAGYAVTTSREVIESGPLPTNTSAQKAEIIALIRALELAKGKEINIYTDSRYAFGVVHAHGAIWKERGLLNSQGKSIKHAQEILRLLDAIQLPERVAVMHIKAHQKVSSELEEGNMLADREANEAAKGEVPDKTVEAALIPDGKVSIEGKPVYNKKDKKLIKVEKASYNQEGWAVTEEGKLVVPSYLLWSLVQREHEKTHWGIDALYNHLKERIIAKNCRAQ
ncbi:hypothetical protein DUI87_17748 [Hirundo rustica rustica]|uniref:ribonuclease H n=1 Tax=Hirundo rustica rustica TaxID=333673 RepID=A0A3M0JXH9_HIRRU|nr:hypothetical protein DUI87_17748 [Hirundo rustica rustica]